MLYLPLTGINSTFDAEQLQQALHTDSSLTDVRVEAVHHRISISQADAEHVRRIQTKLSSFGYAVPEASITFPVLQLSCASCASSAESILRAQAGILDVSLQYGPNLAQVRYIPALVSPSDMQIALQSVGYDMIVEEEQRVLEDVLAEVHAKAYAQLKQRTLWASLFTLPVVIIGMFGMDWPYANELMAVLSTPVVIWFGRGFFRNAWLQATHRSTTMDTLVALSTGIAYVFSLFSTVYPDFWHHRGLHAHVYFEAAAVIITFILLGRLLEERAKGNTSLALKKLMGLQPNTVHLVTESGDIQTLDIAQVRIGMTVLVKPGETLPVDGEVVHGSSYVDESMLSGEPIALHKTIGSHVFAGTINQQGSLQLKSLKVGKETTLSAIIRMVQQAQASKAPVQKQVDRIASVFVPMVLLIAVLTMILWLVFGGNNAVTQGILSMITVLVIACPCALGLATPTAIMVGMGKGASHGILIKDAESLEQASKITAVVLDKTGTLTEGAPSVTDAHWLDANIVHKQALKSIELHSEHPLAGALVNLVQNEQAQEVHNFTSLTGHGVTATVNGKHYLIGNRSLLTQHQISIPPKVERQTEEWTQSSKTLVWMAADQEVVAVLALSDPLKSGSKEAVEQLHRNAITVVMLTGDIESTAQAIAHEVGIKTVYAGASPVHKAEVIKALQQKGHIVAMVGDGINDSAALAQADVSVAMGKGSDIAMSVAKMTFVSSDLRSLSKAIRLSKLTVRTIHQNLFWAFIYNLIGIPIAAGLLYPFTGFLMNPMIAGAAMALSSVSVVSNSLRLNRKHI